MYFPHFSTNPLTTNGSSIETYVYLSNNMNLQHLSNVLRFTQYDAKGPAGLVKFFTTFICLIAGQKELMDFGRRIKDK